MPRCGKSALLVHWLSQIPRDVGIVFVPVSLQFQTAQPMVFVSALALRLARIHGKKLPPSDLWNVHACRETVTQLLQQPAPDGRRILCLGSLKSPHQLPSPEVLIAAVETELLSPKQVFSALAFTLDRSHFEERAERLAPVLAPSIGLALADLIDLRPPSLYKVRVLASVASELRGTNSIRIVDRATRAAKACREDFERLSSAILLLPFRSPGRQAAEAMEAAARLRDYVGRRISPILIERLSPHFRDGVTAFVRAEIERYFVHPGLAPDPAASRVFALLPRSDQQGFIQRALARATEEDLKDRGAVLAIVGPWMSVAQRDRLLLKIAGLPVTDWLLLVSQFVTPEAEQGLPQVGERIKREVFADAALLGRTPFINWSNLLGAIRKEAQSAVAQVLVAATEPIAGTSLWLDLLTQILPYLPIAKKRALTETALRQGRQHLDEQAILGSLGEALRLLPSEKQGVAGRRLAGRIDDYLRQRPPADGPGRVLLATLLLTYMEPAAATPLAETAFEYLARDTPAKISRLCEILPFLSQSSQPRAIEMVRFWAANVEGYPTESVLLQTARRWLTEPEFEHALRRLRVGALKEAEPRLVAFNLVRLVPLLPPSEVDALSLRIFDLAAVAAQWDDEWSFVISSIIPTRDETWLLGTLYPLIAEQRALSWATVSGHLFDIAMRCSAPARETLIGQATDLLPLAQWPIGRFVELLPLLEKSEQRRLIGERLRSLSNQNRVRQLRPLGLLLPSIARLGGASAVERVWESLWELSLWWP
jgi:hypothetical protein